jgi:hypothetical protein
VNRNRERLLHKIIRLSAVAVLAAPLAALVSTGAFAQADRTFVSGAGSDSNPCSLTAPCRTFAQAITQTNANGEITVLDSAGYGSVTITKSISIIAPDGIEAGVTVTSGNAIDIAGLSNSVVNLRGLTIEGSGTATNGIDYSSSGILTVENCVVRNFTQVGILAEPTASSTLAITDTIAEHNGQTGILVQPSGGTATIASFERIQALSNGTGGGLGNSGIAVSGGTATGSVAATAADSIASGNDVGFFVAQEADKATTVFSVVNSRIAGNATGVASFGSGASMYLSNNTITGNSTGCGVANGNYMFTLTNNLITDSNCRNLADFSAQ